MSTMYGLLLLLWLGTLVNRVTISNGTTMDGGHRQDMDTVSDTRQVPGSEADDAQEADTTLACPQPVCPQPTCPQPSCPEPVCPQPVCPQIPCTPPVKDCQDLRDNGHYKDGLYSVYLGGGSEMTTVYCDMETTRGWLVFQKRQDGSTNFTRSFADYARGFGEKDGEFWLGNDALHMITQQKRYTLRVEFTAFDGSAGYAEYTTFRVASAADKYRLSIGGYSGNTSHDDIYVDPSGYGDDAFHYLDGMRFSTIDQDNDVWHKRHCAADNKGGWWYKYCKHPCPNGVYYHTASTAGDRIFWNGFNNRGALKSIQLKLSPAN